MRGRKGLSAVITTLIIILLVLVAIGVVWVVVKSIIQDGSEQVGLDQFTLDLEIKSVKVEGSDVTTVVVRRNPGQGNFIGINFIFSNGTDSEIIRENVSLNEFEERSFIFTLTEISATSLKEVSVAPIYESTSGKENTGNVADKFEIKEGFPGTGDVVSEPPSNFEKLGFSGLGREEYSISSQAEDIVKIKKAIVDPVDVLPGDNQTFTVHVYSPHGVVSVVSTTELDNSTLDLDLQEIGEENGDQIFSATWVVNDVHAITYRTTIVATDAEGNSDSVTLTWTDSCQSLIAFSDHGIATKTILSPCTTTASAIGGVDGSNIVIGANVNLIIAGGSKFIFNSGKSITITASGASITSTSTGSFGNGNLYYTDADGDNYISGASDNLALSGDKRASAASLLGVNDCNDVAASGGANVNTDVVNLGADIDKDRYSAGGTGTRCVGGKSSYWYKAANGAYTWISTSDDLGTTDCNTGDADVFQTIGPATITDLDQDRYSTGLAATNYCLGPKSSYWYRNIDGAYSKILTTDTIGSSDCNDASGSVWVNAYADSDGDGYGTGSLGCRGSASSATNDDCCDNNANARPGQTAWYTTTVTGSGCTANYDWNCASGEQKQYTGGGGVCGLPLYYDGNWDCGAEWDMGNGVCDCDFGTTTAGWQGSEAACGATANYVTSNSCPGFGPGCPSSRTQGCH